MASDPNPAAGPTQTQRPAPPQQKSSSQPKVDVTIDPTSHLDPGAYVRGTLPIKIGQNVLVHPRVYLLSIHSPLTIGDGCIISEKVVLGGPVPLPPSLTTSSSTSSSTEQTPLPPSTSTPTTISSNVHIHPSATINHGATIKSFAIIESNVTVASNATVGSHSKISAGLTVSGVIPDWTVVWGSDGDQKRRSRWTRHEGAADDVSELVEGERLKAMQKERDGTMAIFKANAARGLAVAVAAARKR